MKRIATTAIALMLATVTAHAQTKLDRETVHNIRQAFCTAFSKHDGHQLARLMAEDIDFVVVGATWLHGRSDFDKYHTRLLNGRFHEMTLEPLQVAVRFLHPDVAVVHWSWTGNGDRTPMPIPDQAGAQPSS